MLWPYGRGLQTGACEYVCWLLVGIRRSPVLVPSRSQYYSLNDSPAEYILRLTCQIFLSSVGVDVVYERYCQWMGVSEKSSHCALFLNLKLKFWFLPPPTRMNGVELLFFPHGRSWCMYSSSLCGCQTGHSAVRFVSSAGVFL